MNLYSEAALRVSYPEHPAVSHRMERGGGKKCGADKLLGPSDTEEGQTEAQGENQLDRHRTNPKTRKEACSHLMLGRLYTLPLHHQPRF